MGNSYNVPRSVKGESRILLIFSVKSFLLTVAFAVVGLLITLLLNVLNISIIIKIVIIVVFGGIGFAIGEITIPDSPVMGKLRKAGGEKLFDILLRIITFRGRKKIYLYNYKREKGGTK